ncbi:EamA family transporter [Cellulomonas sp. zg-ZUI222]|uniref:EamA family transporter n=1 Tax=Cellulomonas wangleii TaxID=2816956 RepID=A0ABX8D309_9CELL|nr:MULTISPECIES: DMT family transporter [Cellulomonas]MBO0899835.1 EamA family transporter [Cellulomonas sp. zg-ZUI22]MBO0920696.1 EamA family transporter [Cellulomonas wangleii]MBO0922886.1 EamA family transporter [Cellulomonas wangleii]QVI61285.1 EamA family transporter [Cellulomonas wangleii]
MTSEKRVLAQYLAAALVWGSSFLFMKVALDGLSPTQVASGRLWLGALAMLVVMVVLRRPWPRGWRTWGHLAVLGVLLCVVPFELFAWAGQYLASGLSSILNATTPLMTSLAVAAVLPAERLTARQRLGLAVGGLGVVVVMAPWTYVGAGAVDASLPAVLACLGATACYGLGMTYLRRFVMPLGLPAETVAAGQIGVGALLVLLAAPVVATGPVTLTWPIVLSMVALGALGTGMAYVWNTRVVVAWGAQRASTVTYLTPVVGVVLGILVLGERLHWYEPVGGLLVVLGVVVAQRAARRPAAARPAPPAAPVTAVTTSDQGSDLDARPT